MIKETKAFKEGKEITHNLFEWFKTNIPNNWSEDTKNSETTGFLVIFIDAEGCCWSEGINVNRYAVLHEMMRVIM